jgi:hypothetical protein
VVVPGDAVVAVVVATEPDELDVVVVVDGDAALPTAALVDDAALEPLLLPHAASTSKRTATGTTRIRMCYRVHSRLSPRTKQRVTRPGERFTASSRMFQRRDDGEPTTAHQGGGS